jgi:hypothetical protein
MTYWAYTLIPGFDFVSNVGELLLVFPGAPDAYEYDDGSTENLLGWSYGGEIAWLHWFDSGTNDTITSIGTAFGSALYTGYNPGNGTAADLWMFTDPNNDADPADNALQYNEGVTVVNVDTDIVNFFTLGTAQAVTGGFWVGASQVHNSGQYVCPMDTSVNGPSWVTGAISPDLWDPTNWDFDITYKMDSIGYPCVFLLRADND